VTGLPEQFPNQLEPASGPENHGLDQSVPTPPFEAPPVPSSIESAPTPPASLQENDDLLFQQFVAPSLERIPHLGHVGILCLIALCSLFCAGLLARVGIHFRLFGVTTFAQAASEIHYTLGTEGLLYLFTLGGSLIVFPMVWRKGFFDGLQWRGHAALQRSGYLVAAAVACFALAILNGLLLPGPTNTPIDKIFRIPGAAWMLFGFGVTFAPFFEEMGFRGFLLPAFCTAFDWTAEKAAGQPRHPLDENGHPQWSIPAMVVAAIITSILFAFLHADQTGYSLGPFLLLVCVSLVLCWARLATRSLAASVIVHASYNFLLFSLMFFGTSGFRHLDRM